MFSQKTISVLIAAAAVTMAANRPAVAQELWELRDGQLTISLDLHDLDHLGLQATAVGQPVRQEVTLPIARGTDLTVTVDADTAQTVQSDYVGLAEPLRISGPAGDVMVVGVLLDEAALGVNADVDRAAATTGDPAVLIMRHLRVRVHRDTGALTLPGMSIDLSPGLARALGDESLAGESIGYAVVQGTIARVGGEETAAVEPVEPAPVPLQSIVDTQTPSAAADGPNMTFCELYDLRQFGRAGSILGLALATTSWNVGTADLMWFGIPGRHHPFIVQNLYRLEDDRFEHIGQSWVKHGFYALGSEQCSTACTYEPGHTEGDWLGVGCTDTYTASLNASQSGLGPRNEINPWTGAFSYVGSHFETGHGHDGQIEHRLQVDENDVDVAQHPGALFFAEGYYVVGDDVEHMNNASWKPVTPSGVLGGTWNFAMTWYSTRPTTGFAVDAWTGARQTVLAQDVPPVEFVSPDGRCVLAAKATDLGAGVWHYEYALLNVDMARAVKSFSVPIPSVGVVSNVGFNAVRSHDEPFSNVPWTSTVGTDAITWSTDTNPLRWGTLYNFWFDVNALPRDTTVTITHYEPGTPETVSGVTTGPSLVPPECLPSASPIPDASGIARNRYLTVTGGNPGELTAIRVRLNSLLHPPEPGNGASQPSFAAFEGEVRWVGPPSTYPEGTAGGDTFTAAALQCDPYFTDWGTLGPIHVYGAEIVPFSSYDVQEVHATCQSSLNIEAAYSTALPVPTAHWGDIVAPFAGDPGVTSPVDFRDIAAIVEKFVGSLEPIKARAQLTSNVPDPSANVDFRDISACVAAFVDGIYPFEGPVSCQ